MRAYLIAQVEAEPGIGTPDAVVIDSSDVFPSSRAGSDATRGRTRDVRDVAPGCFATLALTERGGAVRRLLRVDGIDMSDLDACLAATVVFQLDAIVLPARDGSDVAHLGSLLAVHEAEHGLPDGGMGIVALVSCAAGVLAAASFVGASRRLRGLAWDAAALARQLGMPGGSVRSADIVSPPPPHPEVPQRSGGLGGGLQPAARRLKPSSEARLRLASQDEGAGRTRGMGSDPWGWSPVLAHARAVVRLTAAAAGVEAIEAAYPGDDAASFAAHVAAARRDGFGGMFVRDPAQVPIIRAET
ncbi:hypothetical protein [Methylobacterium haplocladii]|uniref:HpcH/HpaI aldolase/citrate lyase domain-containing protein n=1 Tax=Methylobacterium haplocladii TaxID=1176176 RepID=A0A512IUG2_9HYPH|nr:hypothetical protein [Methylobacterium haplocladii]GEP01279.1 hypothetical protein MHA02_36660 [Methylobacterium haplocladii]GJD86126.1 hypothetical protein HPGCJGGD_4023 [Methylobacterium haplocladii]GLS60766.1 hypothetical protein GCM10007887_34530 [Methylobacterium haplocladii]